MDPQTRQDRMDAFAQLCRNHGLPLTIQRRLILSAVLELDNHPTADQIHELVAQRLTGISRTTIYRSLETLVRLGVITKACHPGSVVRFDPRTETHHHLICLRCDQVLDISDHQLDALRLPDTSAVGFEISDFRVQMRGTCRRCKELEEGS